MHTDMARFGRLLRFLGRGAGSPSGLAAYGVAVLAAMVACLCAIGVLLLAVLFAPALLPIVPSATFASFLAAVSMSAWYGGLGPGLLSTSASVVLVDYLFERPVFMLTLTSATIRRELGFFVLATLLTCLCRATLHRVGTSRQG